MRSEGLHDAAAIRLLVVADLHLVDGSFQAKYLGGIRESGSPLTGSGFGGDVGYAFFLAIIGLCNGRVQFVRTDGTDTFVFEIVPNAFSSP